MNESIDALVSAPWALDWPVLKALSERISRGPLVPTAPEAARRQERAAAKPPAPRGVAFIPVYGVLLQRPSVLHEIFGGYSTTEIGMAVDQAAADPAFEAIILDVDSPGGSVYGTAELGAKVADAAKVKPVIAVANSEAASAAYWVASQASELVVTPGGMVGSVGVFRMHVDMSEAMKQAGMAVTFVYAGERKAVNNQYAPLNEASRAELEQQVQGYYSQFVNAVAAGRRTSPGAVRAGFGKGGMVLARDAVREGMADRVGTLDDVLARYGHKLGGPGGSASSGWASGRATTGPDADHRHAIEVRKRKLLLDADHQPAGPPIKSAGQAPAPAAATPPPAAPARPYWGGRYDRALAVHEAGHVAAAVHLGGYVERVTIEPTAGADGHVLHAPGLSRFNQLVVYKAGAAAVRVLGHDSSGSPPNADGDERLARELSPDPREHAAAEREAAFIITHNAGRVIALADALQKHRTLTAADVKGIIGGR